MSGPTCKHEPGIVCVDPSGDPNILGWAQLPSLQQLKQGIQDFNDQLDKEIAERNQNKLETPTKGRALATGNGDASPARTRLRRKKNADSVNSPSVEDRMKAAQEKEDKEEASNDDNIYKPARLEVEAEAPTRFSEGSSLYERSYYLNDSLPSSWSLYADTMDNCYE